MTTPAESSAASPPKFGTSGTGKSERTKPGAAKRQESAVSGERVPYDEPQTWYFTFGFAHAHPDCYVRFDGMGGDDARAAMHLRFGRAWAFQYDERDWFKHGVSMAEKHGLTEVE